MTGSSSTNETSNAKRGGGGCLLWCFVLAVIIVGGGIFAYSKTDGFQRAPSWFATPVVQQELASAAPSASTPTVAPDSSAATTAAPASEPPAKAEAATDNTPSDTPTHATPHRLSHRQTASDAWEPVEGYPHVIRRFGPQRGRCRLAFPGGDYTPSQKRGLYAILCPGATERQSHYHVDSIH